MKSLLRPAAVVSSLTIFATYVHLQGSGRSLMELWSPTTAEAGSPLPMNAARDDDPVFAYREPGMPATKSAALPVKFYPQSSVTPGGYSSGVFPGSTAAPQWLPTAASNPVPAAFPDPNAVRMLAGSKSLPMPVQVAPQATVKVTQADVAAAKPRQQPMMLSGSKSTVMPVTVTPGTLPTAAAPAGIVRPFADNPPIVPQSGGSYGWMNRPSVSPMLSSNAPPPPVQPYKAYPFRFMAATKAAVMPVQLSPSLPVVVAPQPTNEYQATAVQPAAPQAANAPAILPQSYAPGQSLNAPRVAPQYPLFQGVPAAVPANRASQK